MTEVQLVCIWIIFHNHFTSGHLISLSLVEFYLMYFMYAVSLKSKQMLVFKEGMLMHKNQTIFKNYTYTHTYP